MATPENAPESATRGESNFGARLRRLREQRQLKQAEVAELTGIPAAYISLIENGKLIPAATGPGASARCSAGRPKRPS